VKDNTQLLTSLFLVIVALFILVVGLAVAVKVAVWWFQWRLQPHQASAILTTTALVLPYPLAQGTQPPWQTNLSIC